MKLLWSVAVMAPVFWEADRWMFPHAHLGVPCSSPAVWRSLPSACESRPSVAAGRPESGAKNTTSSSRLCTAGCRFCGSCCWSTGCVGWCSSSRLEPSERTGSSLWGNTKTLVLFSFQQLHNWLTGWHQISRMIILYHTWDLQNSTYDTLKHIVPRSP